ncbi:MAG TPA: copper resistance CopC family protein [Pseudonocardia sp.]
MRLPRFALMLVLTVIGVVGLATPAWAHAVLESSTPAQNASLPAPPTELKLTFGEAVTLPTSPIVVVGPGGALWQLGEPTIAGPVITVPVTSATGPAGPYVLTYRVIADDGDSVGGNIRFTMATASRGTSAVPATSAAPTSTPSTDFVPGAAPASTSGGGVPVWVWVLVVAVVIVGAGVIVNRSRRS